MNNCFEIEKELLSSIANKNSLDMTIPSPMLEYMGCSGCLEGQRRCGMILTKKCQLRCTYCYEKGKNASSMDFEMAKSIVQKELGNDDSVKSVHIDLFGGEPLLVPELIKTMAKEILRYCKDRSVVNTVKRNVAK